MKKISVVVPMYYEEQVAEECYKRTKSVLESLKEKYDYEIIFINDGSKDKTLNILEKIAKDDENVKIISFSRNFGHQAAVTAGLQYVTGDACVIMDADLQDPPELIPDMITYWENGYDVIYGKRKKRDGESAFKLLTAKAFYNTLNNLSDVEIPKDTGDFRLVDKKVVDVVNAMPEHNKFLRGLFSWVGFNQYAYEYERKERVAGKTKYPLKKMVKLAEDGIISFSNKPLKIVGKLGIISVIISIIILIYAILSYANNWNNLVPRMDVNNVHNYIFQRNNINIALDGWWIHCTYLWWSKTASTIYYWENNQHKVKEVKPMWGDIAIALLLAFITSFVTVPYTIKLAKKVGAIDMPSDRRVNKKPIPRIGGIAIIAGFLVSSIYLIITMCIEKKLNLNDADNYTIKLIGFFAGIIIISTFAYLDDVKNLKPWEKLIAQVAAAAVVYASGIKIDVINGYVLKEWLSCIITIGWIVGITNAINLIDGLDGLSSGITLISSFLLLIIFATNNSPVISVILISCLGGAVLGFMPFNINPAKTFMGDVGAQFLGFSLAVISILGVAKTVTLFVLVAPVLVLGLPIFDTLYAIVRRMKNGKSVKAIFQADKGHLHHRLMRMGYTQKQAVAILYAVSATLGLLAIILIEEGVWKALSFFLVLVAVIALGFKEVKKYKEDLIEENISEHLVDEKDLDLREEEKEREEKKAQNK